jgi:hypothetical protein
VGGDGTTESARDGQKIELPQVLPGHGRTRKYKKTGRVGRPGGT